MESLRQVNSVRRYASSSAYKVISPHGIRGGKNPCQFVGIRQGKAVCQLSGAIVEVGGCWVRKLCLGRLLPLALFLRERILLLPLDDLIRRRIPLQEVLEPPNVVHL